MSRAALGLALLASCVGPGTVRARDLVGTYEDVPNFGVLELREDGSFSRETWEGMVMTEDGCASVRGNPNPFSEGAWHLERGVVRFDVEGEHERWTVHLADAIGRPDATGLVIEFAGGEVALVGPTRSAR